MTARQNSSGKIKSALAPVLGQLKAILTYFGASLIPMLLNLVANPWIAKNMDPRDYAISGYDTSYSSLRSPIIIYYLIRY